MLASILLAAGDSKRFGSNKLLEPLHGRPLIQYSLSAIEELGSHLKVLVTQDSTLKKIQPSLTNKWDVVSNKDSHKELNHSLQLGVSHVLKNKDITWILIHLGDLPLVTSEQLQYMIDTRSNCLSTFQQTIGPPIVINREKSQQLLKHLQENPLLTPKAWLKKQKDFWPYPNEFAAMDIDTTKDFVETQKNKAFFTNIFN